jgi:hypothetical protein
MDRLIQPNFMVLEPYARSAVRVQRPAGGRLDRQVTV